MAANLLGLLYLDSDVGPGFVDKEFFGHSNMYSFTTRPKHLQVFSANHTREEVTKSIMNGSLWINPADSSLKTIPSFAKSRIRLEDVTRAIEIQEGVPFEQSSKSLFLIKSPPAADFWFHKKLGYPEWSHSINGGIIFVRTNPRAKELLHEWWFRTTMINTPFESKRSLCKAWLNWPNETQWRTERWQSKIIRRTNARLRMWFPPLVANMTMASPETIAEGLGKCIPIVYIPEPFHKKRTIELFAKELEMTLECSDNVTTLMRAKDAICSESFQRNFFNRNEVEDGVSFLKCECQIRDDLTGWPGKSFNFANRRFRINTRAHENNPGDQGRLQYLQLKYPKDFDVPLEKSFGSVDMPNLGTAFFHWCRHRSYKFVFSDIWSRIFIRNDNSEDEYEWNVKDAWLKIKNTLPNFRLPDDAEDMTQADVYEKYIDKGMFLLNNI